MAFLQPRDADDLTEIVRSAASAGEKLELRGGGTKADFGAPARGDGSFRGRAVGRHRL
ncbi:hypothetical protein ACFSTD_18790 [Novosphingobium colocasiae]